MLLRAHHAQKEPEHDHHRRRACRRPGQRLRRPKAGKLLYTLAWGDYVDVLEVTDTHLRIATYTYQERSDGSILPVATEAWLVPPKSARRNGRRLKPADLVIPRADSRVLKVNFVDVQQGDGAVIESPGGKVMLVDGGDNQMFARYLAARYRGSRAEAPKVIDCILVTHGDADHFSGLTQIQRSETNNEPRKRLFIEPRRIYHNGLVKRSKTGRKETELLGPTLDADGLVAHAAAGQPLQVPAEEMNNDFRAWRKALEAWEARAAQLGRPASSSAACPRASTTPSISCVTRTSTCRCSARCSARPVGRAACPSSAARRPPRVGHESLDIGAEGFAGFSASHTINGHSIVFRLRYGGFNYLFCGDLNDEAGRTLARQHDAGEIDLRAEVFKVPHHGSADFSGGFFKRVEAIVNIVSSGDDPMNEYIHPAPP